MNHALSRAPSGPPEDGALCLAFVRVDLRLVRRDPDTDPAEAWAWASGARTGLSQQALTAPTVHRVRQAAPWGRGSRDAAPPPGGGAEDRGHLPARAGAWSGAWPPPGVPHAGSEPRLPPALPPPCGPFCPARAGCSLGLDGPGTLEVSAQMPSAGSPFPACVCRSSDTSPGTTDYTFTFIYQGLRSPCDLFDILPIVSPL